MSDAGLIGLRRKSNTPSLRDSIVLSKSAYAVIIMHKILGRDRDISRTMSMPLSVPKRTSIAAFDRYESAAVGNVHKDRRETEAGSFTNHLRREERFKDPIDDFRRHSAAVVSDG